MTKSINMNHSIALIGCGYWGSILISNLIEIGIKKIYIYDTNVKNSLILKKKFKNLIIAKSYSKLLSIKEIKNFFFATPTSSNYLIIKKAIKFKKNIFVEKPGLIKNSQFKEIKNLVKKNKTILMFGYIYCYHNYINYIKKIINKKKLGKILYMGFLRQNLGPIRNDVNSSFDLASHDLSIILNIFNKLPKIINHTHYPILKKKISDISTLHMKINNIYVDIITSWLNPIKVRRLTIVGNKKMLLFDELNLKSPIKIYNKYAIYPDISKFDKKFLKSKAKIYHGNSRSIKVKDVSPLKKEIFHFFYSIKNKSKPNTDINFAYKIVKFLNRVN